MGANHLPEDAELRAALDDDDLLDGLERLHRLTKLRAIGSLPQAIETAERTVKRSKKVLGKRFAEVERLLPAFAPWAEERDRVEFEWDERCVSCGHSFLPASEKGGDGTMWCELYKVEERTCPDPCPEFQPLKEASSR